MKTDKEMVFLGSGNGFVERVNALEKHFDSLFSTDKKPQAVKSNPKREAQFEQGSVMYRANSKDSSGGSSNQEAEKNLGSTEETNKRVEEQIQSTQNIARTNAQQADIARRLSLTSYVRRFLENDRQETGHDMSKRHVDKKRSKNNLKRSIKRSVYTMKSRIKEKFKDLPTGQAKKEEEKLKLVLGKMARSVQKQKFKKSDRKNHELNRSNINAINSQSLKVAQKRERKIETHDLEKYKQRKDKPSKTTIAITDIAASAFGPTKYEIKHVPSLPTSLTPPSTPRVNQQPGKGMGR